MAAGHALAATVSIEIATEQRSQITAHQQWLQLLAGAGVSNSRIRGIQPGDEPAIETTESRLGVVYLVTAILDNRGRLVVPGGAFTRRDAGKLADYLDRLKVDGPESLTAVRGNYGLTKKEFESIFEELSQPISFGTAELTPITFFEQLGKRLDTQFEIEPTVRRKLGSAKPLEVELQKIAAGTVSAIVAKSEDLVIVPHKPRGGSVVIRVVAAKGVKESWPVGYKPKGAPRTIAPDLMQRVPVEIDGFMLADAMAAITPRFEVPVVWDRGALAKHKIDPAQVPVKLARATMSYKRILERLLFAARLKGALRVDENGKPFFWISK